MPFVLTGVVLPVAEGQKVQCSCDGEPVCAAVESLDRELGFCLDVRIQGFHRGHGGRVTPDLFASIVVPFCVNRDGTAQTWQRKRVMSNSIKTIAQKGGYVPENCQHPAIIVKLLMMENTDPCAGCNHNRGECGGRPKTDRDAPLSKIRR